MNLVVRGGRVWAGRGLRAASALAIQDGRVAAVGADAAVSAFAGNGDRIVELRGRLVVPGLNDAHVHFLGGSAFAEFAEGEKGTLEAGKRGDVAVFAADLPSRPPRDILTTPVDMTVVGGRVVFDREGS